MPAEGSFKKGTKQFMRQGHTEKDAFGSNTSAHGQGKVESSPKEIKP